LLSTWKERTQVVNQTKEVEQVQRKQAVKTHPLVLPKEAVKLQVKKTYRRADIIELMRTNPDRYEQLAPEIMQAYAEGRVK
jgi:predicted polyphosphate/ATP-dependent NAD kinase